MIWARNWPSAYLCLCLCVCLCVCLFVCLVCILFPLSAYIFFVCFICSMLFSSGSILLLLSDDCVWSLVREIAEKKFKIIICDESHFLKNRLAKRTQALCPILKVHHSIHIHIKVYYIFLSLCFVCVCEMRSLGYAVAAFVCSQYQRICFRLFCLYCSSQHMFSFNLLNFNTALSGCQPRAVAERYTGTGPARGTTLTGTLFI